MYAAHETPRDGVGKWGGVHGPPHGRAEV